MVPSKEAIHAYAQAVLIAFQDLHLDRLYTMYNISHLSPGQLRAHGPYECYVPQYLLDMVREVCRPVYHAGYLWVPVASVESATDSCVDIGKHLGMSKSEILSLSTWLLNHSGPESFPCRTLVKEFQLLVSPGSVADGKYFFADSFMSKWRLDCVFLLRSFVNGCPQALSSLPLAREVPLYSLDLFVERKEAATTRFRLEEAHPTFQDEGELSAELEVVLYKAILHCEPFKGKYYLYWGSDRLTTYQRWLHQGIAGSSVLPDAMICLNYIALAAKCMERFPVPGPPTVSGTVTSKGSRTPKRNGPRPAKANQGDLKDSESNRNNFKALPAYIPDT